MPEPLESTTLSRRANLSPAVPIFRVESLDASVAWSGSDFSSTGEAIPWLPYPGNARPSCSPRETRANGAPGCGSPQATSTTSMLSFKRGGHVFATHRRITLGVARVPDHGS